MAAAVQTPASSTEVRHTVAVVVAADPVESLLTTLMEAAVAVVVVVRFDLGVPGGMKTKAWRKTTAVVAIPAVGPFATAVGPSSAHSP